MALHNERGKNGEELACDYLKAKDFIILYCNWRFSRWEIDIIAEKEGFIRFIEVKTRHSLKFGYPEEAVTKKKFNNLKKAAAAFLHAHPVKKKIQFDVLSILRLNNQPVEYLLLEDVYL